VTLAKGPRVISHEQKTTPSFRAQRDNPEPPVHRLDCFASLAMTKVNRIQRGTVLFIAARTEPEQARAVDGIAACYAQILRQAGHLRLH
jgi:hypothetical protein